MKKFTQKMIVGLSSLVLAFVAIVSTEGASYASSASAVVSRQSFETSGVVPGAQATNLPPAANRPEYQLISSWYKNKHWWKRNAPIVGGAGGGALVGGLLGGGKGAIIGGAVGGGGGYLYKHFKHHKTRDDNRHEHPHSQTYGNQYQHAAGR
jgi:hypothetical protein